MKIFKRVLLGILSLIVLLVLAISGLLFWTVKNPKDAWQIVEQRFLPQDLKITWSQMDLSVNHLGGLNFNLDWQIDELSVLKAEPKIQIPVQRIHIDTSIFPRASAQKIAIHQLIIKADKSINMAFGPSKDNEQQNPFQILKSAVDGLKMFRNWVDLQAANVDIKDVTFRSGESAPITLALKADKSKEDPGILKYSADMALANDLKVKSSGQFIFHPENMAKIDLDSSLVVSGFGIETSQKIDFNILDDTFALKVNGPLNYSKGTFKVYLKPQANLKMTSDGAEILLTSDIKGIGNSLAKIESATAELKMPFDKNVTWSDRPSAVQVEAPIKIFSAEQNSRKIIENECACTLPSALNFRARGNVWLAYLTNETDSKKQFADINLTIDDVANKLLSLKTSAHIQLFRDVNTFSFLPSLTLDAHIARFKVATRVLDTMKILVPAPLDVLDGTVDLKMAGPINTTDTSYQFPVQASAKLSSDDQAVDIHTESQVNLDSQFKGADVNVKVSVNQLRLQLPPLKPTKGNPRILADKRIIAVPKAAVKASAFKFTLAVDVQTKQPGAIQLSSEFFKPHLPISIDFSRSQDQENLGTIALEPFDIVYLRRRVHLEKMKIDMSKSSEDGFYVDGRLSVKQTQYMVFIDILGPSNKPNIVLTSEPDLPRSEIINVLLFDQTSEQMSSGDVETSGQVEAAVADKAIGLFGIWAFASTPIKGFSYNPSTKVYTATVQLSDDVTASIGTRWEATSQVELRKRVSRRWVLTAAWTPADQDEAENTKLVLQWERRF